MVHMTVDPYSTQKDTDNYHAIAYLVVITTTKHCVCHTVLQKSPKVFGRGPENNKKNIETHTSKCLMKH